MSAFWTFTLDVYGRDGVQSSVIHLQDARGADVNLLLYAMWTAGLGLPAFDVARAAELAAMADPWRAAAIEPLRAVRTALKAGVAHVPSDEADGLRRQVLKLEIEGERIEQATLEQATPQAAGREQGAADPAVVATNLAAVMALNPAPLAERDREALHLLIVAACPGTAPDEAAAALSGS